MSSIAGPCQEWEGGWRLGNRPGVTGPPRQGPESRRGASGAWRPRTAPVRSPSLLAADKPMVASAGSRQSRLPRVPSVSPPRDPKVLQEGPFQQRFPEATVPQ